jgi:cytochrome c5
MAQNDDKAFIRKFSAIILGFIALTVVLIFLARSMQSESGIDANPSQGVMTEKRISPVSGVHVGEEGAAALAAEQAASAPAPVEVAAAEIDGEKVYNGLCMTCHDAGVAGAPVKGSEDMAIRVGEKGMDSVVASAINGLNVMPPRGGNPALTDEEIRAAVEFMVN